MNLEILSKHRELLFAQGVISLILKLQDIAICTAKFSTIFF